MVGARLEEAHKLVEEGLEARLAHVEANAAERRQLIEIQGDANHTAERRAKVAEVARSE